MNIAIIAAMSKELALLLPMIGDHSKVSVNGMTFHTGHIGRHKVVATECGIGKVNAAIGSLTLIETFHPSLVINTGVAGGIGRDVGILDVIIADKVGYHDVWCGPGTVPGQAAGFPLTFNCPLGDEIFEGLGVKRGMVASGDIFVSRRDVGRILEVCPDAVAVDMESAAIAQVCELKSVPFVCIRVISDNPEEAGNDSQYNNFWSEAPSHTFAVLTKILERL